MKHFCFRLIAAASLLAAGSSVAHCRPHYGGTLRVEMQSIVRDLSPADWPTDPIGSTSKARLVKLVFEGLVELDDAGMPRPALAFAWTQDPDGRRWRFYLRPNVRFHDRSPLTPESVVSALGGNLRDCEVSAGDGSVSIEAPEPRPGLPLELAGARHSIWQRATDGGFVGTGPFRVSECAAGPYLLLVAYDDCWRGRPFLDSVSIRMGRSLRDQMLDLELGKAEIVEVPPDAVRGAAQRGARLWYSQPNVLIGLLFDAGRPSTQDRRLREAVALAIDRSPVHSVLLQNQGEPTGALLPQWLSGFAFLHPPAVDLPRARQLIASLATPVPSLTLACDSSDPLAQLIADRIALDAREAGITLRTSTLYTDADLHLVQLPIASPRPDAALIEIVRALGRNDMTLPPPPAELQAVQAAESLLLGDYRVIPLFHVPTLYASSTRVRSWATRGLSMDGAWRFEDLWLEGEAP